MNKKNNKKELKRKRFKAFYRCFIITCFIISIVCLFKHQEAEKSKNMEQQISYIIKNEKTEQLIEDFKNGKIEISISNFYFSIIIVTGPSFNKLTFISAPNIPFSTFISFLVHSSQKYSYSSSALSGLAASIKDGLFP